MTPREELLQTIEQALSQQVISPQDLQAFIPHAAAEPREVAPETPVDAPTETKKNLSVIDMLFYLAGIILFAALMTIVAQIGEDGLVSRLMVSVGMGLVCWTAAFALSQQPNQNDTRAGLINSLLLTGSLSVVAGSFILTTDFTDNSTGQSVSIIYAITLLILGVVHVLFDRLLRSTILIVFGLAFFVLAFPTAIETILATHNPPVDVWGVVGIITGLLFAYGGSIISRSAEGRARLKGSFESLGGFVVLSSIYGTQFGSSAGVLWELLLPLTIYAAFFISITRRSKQFLVTGSLFLVIFLITVSFKYFSGLGAAFSLILSALSILATAFVAANINKKYFKPPTK